MEAERGVCTGVLAIPSVEQMLHSLLSIEERHKLVDLGRRYEMQCDP